jgi:hypothetical protein
MAITKTEIITALDDGISTAITNLNNIMSTGDISNEAHKIAMATYLTNITRLTNAKIWVEANL